MDVDAEIPKPDGFDLRNRRAEKAADGSQWTAGDALYDARHRQKSSPNEVKELVVYWVEKKSDGTRILRYASACKDYNEHLALLAIAYNEQVNG